MRLEECFEKIATESWLENLGPYKDLYNPSVKIDDPKLLSYNWFHHILGVQSGKINYETLWRNYFSDKNYIKAYEILHHFSKDKKLKLEKQLKDKIELIHSGCLDRFKKLEEIYDNISQKRLSEDNKLILDEIILSLNDLSKSITGRIDLENIALYIEALKKIDELEEFLFLIDEDVFETEKQIVKEAFGIFQKVLKILKQYLLEGEHSNKKNIERCFCILPSLVLNGKVELLKKILKSIEDQNFEKITDVYIPLSGGYSSVIEAVPKLKLENIKSNKLKFEKYNLSSTTIKYIYATSILEEEFKNVDECINFIEEKVRKSKTFRDASGWLLKGAKKIMTLGEYDITEVLARGLTELGEHLLSIRKYNHAFEIFLDSLSLWTLEKKEIKKLSINEKKSITGTLLSNWIPREVSRKSHSEIDEIVKSVYKNPQKMLGKIIEGHDRDILYHFFDVITGDQELKALLKYLYESYPNVDWIAIFLERVLQPRLFLREPNRSLMQLQVLVIERFQGTILERISDKLGFLVDSYNNDKKVSFTELSEIKQLQNELISEIKEHPKGHISTLTTFHEGISSIIDMLKSRTPTVENINFTVRPVNSLYYLEEKNKGLELILSITVNEESLPVSFLSIQARIEKKFQMFISFKQSKMDIGPIDPGTNIEACFYFDIDPKILEEYHSASIELIFYEGIKIIDPSDKKRIWEINFQQKRKGIQSNPYIAGPAIELGGLYVGRNRELEEIKKTLIGHSQDNLPLVLGIRRIGKTSLIKRIINDKEITKKYIPIFYDLQDMPEDETTSMFFKKMCSNIHDSCGIDLGIPFTREKFDSDPFDYLEKYIKQFDSAKINKRILLVFDEFEKLVTNLRKWQNIIVKHDYPPSAKEALVPEVFGALRKIMLHSNTFSFLIAGLPVIKTSFQDYEARWFGLMSLINISPLLEDDVKRLINPDGLPYNVSAEASREVLYMSGGQPYLIQLICKNLFNEICRSGRETVAKLDVENTVEFHILPNEEFFADYYRLMGEDQFILKAMAVCHKKAGIKRRYITINEIHDNLVSKGLSLSKESLLKKLKQMEKADRPLVQRRQSRFDSYRIVIGLLSRLLEEDSI